MNDEKEEETIANQQPGPTEDKFVYDDASADLSGLLNAIKTALDENMIVVPENILSGKASADDFVKFYQTIDMKKISVYDYSIICSYMTSILANTYWLQKISKPGL